MIKCLNFHYSNNTENKENKEEKKANCSSFEKLLEISKFIIMDMAIN